MKWTRGYRSNQVDDRRHMGSGMGSSALHLPLVLFKTLGWPGLVVGAALLYFSGGFSDEPDPRAATTRENAASPVQSNEVEMVEFVSFVLDDVQRTWAERLGSEYRLARLVIFRGSTASRCGTGQAAMGPFYCSRDEQAYIDLSFYAELKNRFGAPGDFAQAYVMAHEIGHHVQHLMGTAERVQRQPRSVQQGPEGLSTRLELQADCYAGIWAHSAQERELLEVGDVDEALRAAAAIGDDVLQKQAGGAVAPETWTHGSSNQRVRWFKRGLERGSLEACNTFATGSP